MYNTIILNGNITAVIDTLNSMYDELSLCGNLFCLISSEYDEKGNVTSDFLDVIKAGDVRGYKYVNTIICINQYGQRVNFYDNVYYLVWFAKDLNKQYFSKDPIRESHIWEKVEWGKRAKNYNPKGKDPGNVWIPTEDDGAAHITKHILLPITDIIKRILLSTMQGEHSTAFIYTDNEGVYRGVDDERVTVRYVANDVLCNKPLLASVDDNQRRVESKVIFASSENMSMLKRSSVDLVVTSPPYWDLKDYFKKGQIGQEPYGEYIDRMKVVWKECFNVLKKSGTMWININIRRRNGKVVLIPWDFVRICKEIGFYYKGIIIWHKSSGIPTGDRNLVDRHEYVLLFSKSETLHINGDIFASIKDYKNDFINGGAIWNINRKAGSVGKEFIHPAIYPNELVSRIVNISTKPHQVVLDPFLGSGTTLIASEQNQRFCLGFEYNEGFRDLIESRIITELGSLRGINIGGGC